VNRDDQAVRLVLRERAPDAPQWSLARERCGAEVDQALARLRDELPDAPFLDDTVAWLTAAYRPGASLADACATAVNALLGPRGVAVFRAHARPAKAAAVPVVLAGLGATLADGLAPVLVEAHEGRDRLVPDGGAWVTRRSGERFTRAELERLAAAEPERLSPNVLLRPLVEAALFPTVAYLAGPGELRYLPDAAALYDLQPGVTPQTPVARWSGVILETRIEHVLTKLRLGITDFATEAGVLESRLVREQLPAEALAALDGVRDHVAADHQRLATTAAAIDPTLERSVLGARNAALARTERLERRLVAALKRRNGELTHQIARARAALHPAGAPQERVLTVASFLARYGPALLDDLAAEVARHFGAS
jgi:uncharacterized protein YllA (UPF0747 family)